MPLNTYTGIVLRGANYGNYDKLLTVFTREAGKLTMAARGARKQGSPLLALSQPFSYAEYVAFSGAGRTHINSGELKESFYPIREDIDRLAAGSFVLAVTEAYLPDNEPSDEMFTLLYYILSYLAYSELSPLDLSICFMSRALAIAGYMPRLSLCENCGVAADGKKRIVFGKAPSCESCGACAKSGMCVSPLSLEAFRRMSFIDNKNISKVVLPPRVARELRGLLYKLTCDTLEKTFKSFEMITR